MSVNPALVGGRIITRLFGTAVSGAAGFAAGTALGPTLSPLVRLIANDVNAHFPYVPPSAGTLALGVAQGQVEESQARSWAAMHGIGDNAFTALVNVANTGPGSAYAFELWRRGRIGEPGFRRALRRLGIEQEWIDDLVQVKDVLLDPAVIANAVHRGIMRDPTLIVREPPTTPGKVEQVPPSPLDPATEAAGSGLTHERLRVEVGTTGLPPGLIQMLDLLNRGKVTEEDVQRAVAQSNLRNEYMDVVLALRRHLLTPHNYEEAALRGIISRDEADAGAALTGMEKPDAQLLFEIMGRPLTVHQLVTGLERGGVFGGTYNDVPEPYRDAIRRSNIRPEYARLAYANRYTYPSAFVLRSLAQAGELGDTAAVEKILLQIGWPPSLAAKVAPSWAPSGAAADPHVARAQTHLWNTTHNSYRDDETGEAQARGALTTLGLDADAQDQVIALWNAEKALIRRQLSPADLRKAYQKQDLNVATGLAWTREEAKARLLELGYDAEDADNYLNIG